MKTLLFACILVVFYSCGSKKSTQTVNEDSALRQRLAEYMKYNQEMNLDKMMDYTYPKLFTIATRKEMRKVLEETYNSDKIKVRMDSLRIDTIYPVFRLKDGQYAKIKYSMLMYMDYLEDPDTDSEELTANLLRGFTTEFGAENVRLEESGVFRIKINGSPMVAAKDKYSKDWSFVNLDEDEELTNRLFSKEQLAKLASYE